MCLYPKIIQNKKYKENAKNGGVIPAVNDLRSLHTPVGCGECIECKKQNARNWQVRLLEDIKTNTNGKFITLTLSNESYTKILNTLRLGKPERLHKIKSGKNKGKIILIPEELPNKSEGYKLDNDIIKYAIRKFNERWRKRFKKAIRHFMVTELGHNGTENIHLHGIIWTDEKPQIVREVWQYGYIWPRPPYEPKKEWSKQYVNEKTVNYIIKYIIKKDFKHRYYKQKVLTSPGIGSNYVNTINAQLNKFNWENTQEAYRTKSGYKIAMPTYWRNKIYTEIEREILWMQKLDKQERYVCGEKIDVSKSYTDYYNVLDYYRKLNIEKGYGTDKINWKRQEYEHQIRIVKQLIRIKNERIYTTAKK